MSNGLYYGLNKGALLRKIFPKQLNTQAMILTWTIIFICNIVAVFCVHCYILHPISDFSRESLQEDDYFKESKILLVEDYGDYYVTYENADGDKRVARLEMFPEQIIKRARIDKDYDRIARADGSIELEDNVLSNRFWAGNGMDIIVILYIAIGVGLLLFEFFLFSVFYRLFRE